MEDHSQAYFAWKRAGIQAAWCWHVDAHLDIGRDGLEQAALEQLRPALDPLPELTGNPYVPWGGLNCGNYLYPAIRHGLVGRLTWVIPPDLPHGKLLNWARTHLNGWLDLTVEESAGLHDAGGYLEGTLLGIPFQVGPAAALPRPEEPVLLDVDLDYYLNLQGKVWQEPPGPLPSSLFTTVAFSVLGGYTATEQRCLAAPWTDDWSGYQGNALDEAARHVRQRHYQQGLEHLHELSAVEAEYLRGTCQHHLGQFEQALQTWQRLLARVSSTGQAYLAGLASELLSTRLNDPQAALDYAQQGLQIVEDYRLHYAAAVALEQLEQPRQATQMLRRGLRQCEGTVISLQMRRLLARLYRKQGKEGLAQIELAHLRDDLSPSSSVGLFGDIR
ncbi:MAG: hypothetical protein KIS61_26525 [Candidatus Eremiobacteraeota bacterium]|nr:hypothetical protein [Candidatus Eremiobacteraeota bacterium]